ncbi:hypothetical protein HDU76_010907, partial [Blyttiomyces sp. JEL0837]
LRVAFPRLKDKLEDQDPTVVSAAVNVVCELARKNPKSYLPLAPQLYSLLTTSSNNWMLIKIIKLFGALTPLEPRLTKKLISPITSLIQSTNAMSLLYECIHTVITGGMLTPEPTGSEVDNKEDSALAKLCVSKLKLFVEDPDQNLKYLGLFALCKLLPLRPRAVTEHRDVILECLDDRDISIRMRALELISGMVTKRNVVDIVKRLLIQLVPQADSSNADEPQPAAFFPPTLLTSDNSYAKEVVTRILAFCSKNTYELISDFEWYVAVLAELAKIPRVAVGKEISEQLIDVTVRVKNVRGAAVKTSMSLLKDQVLLDSAVLELNNTDVLFAAGWICGEYSLYLADRKAAIEHLVSPTVGKLSDSVRAVFAHAALKIY